MLTRRIPKPVPPPVPDAERSGLPGDWLHWDRSMDAMGRVAGGLRNVVRRKRRRLALGYVITSETERQQQCVIDLTTWAASDGWDLPPAGVHSDDAEDVRRPGFARLMTSLRTERPSALLIRDVNDLGRPGWGDGWATAQTIRVQLGVKVVVMPGPSQVR